MEVTTYKCDECGVMRGPANHWFLARLSNNRFTICPWSVSLTILGEERIFHLCGMECATRAMTKAMDRVPDGEMEVQRGR